MTKKLLNSPQMLEMQKQIMELSEKVVQRDGRIRSLEEQLSR